jgi:hypothetical protein
LLLVFEFCQLEIDLLLAQVDANAQAVTHLRAEDLVARIDEASQRRNKTA